MNGKLSYDLRDHIFKVENFLDKEFCKSLIKKLKKIKYKKHTYGDANLQTEISYKNELEVSIERIPETITIEEKIKLVLSDYIKHYNLKWFSINSLHKFTPIRFNKYKVSTEMRIHADHISSIFDGKEKGIPILTIICTLNENYKGGEFIMFETEEIKMKTGTLLIFPSNFLFPHAVKPITKGKRHSFVSWVW